MGPKQQNWTSLEAKKNEEAPFLFDKSVQNFERTVISGSVVPCPSKYLLICDNFVA